jgi:glycosyltransferase involved in cell wall biosynthesis
MSTAEFVVRVSVLMPSFNQARYIERSVRSVLNQVDTAVELVVMDGYSSDGTQVLLSQLATEFEGRLRWVSESDRGPAHALNKALALARGNVIGWLNSDDVYTPGAVHRAVEYLEIHPDTWMVYGQGEHIDANDHVLCTYPTKLPQMGVAGFVDGCYICQPTVFIRRVVLRMLGEFNEKLKTTFDFDLWFRLFERHGSRIGFINSVQAYSRLHSECITMSQRELVIRESMTLLAHHCGAAPLHWVKTYAEELISDYPHGRQLDDLRIHLNTFAASVADLLTPSDQTLMRDWLEHDARLRLALPDAYLQVHADGWLPAQSELRVRAMQQHWRSVELVGRHVSPKGDALELYITLPDGGVVTHRVASRGQFTLNIELPIGGDQSDRWVLPIKASGCFVPSQCEVGSTDNRELACRIDAMHLIV